MTEQEEFEFRHRLEMEQASKPAAPEKSLGSKVMQQVGNAGAGLLRGAGSIGATLLAPIDIASDALAGKGLSLQSNRERRSAMDAALGSMGAETDSFAYGAGKLGGEIAGTAGAGGLMANGLARVPGVAAAAPNLLTAIRTSGMTTGASSMNALTNGATRMVGGAVAGGASAGLVNPDEAGLGAAIGGAAPVVLKGAGMAGSKVGNALRGPAQSPELAAAITSARGAGYVIPPTQANPNMLNRALEGFSGKITTAQNASARNAEVTERLAAEAVGLPPGMKVTAEALDSVRAEAGQAYAAISKLGKLRADGARLPDGVNVKTGTDSLTMGPRSEVDAGEVVRAWKQANHDATGYYRAYGRDANPETLAKAKAAASDAKKIDDFLEKSLSTMGQGDLTVALKEARVRIAKTYSVESAMNQATGSIDARKLASQLQKGKFLSGGLRDAAEFAGRFPKAAQPVEGMGSLPGTSPLDWHAASATSMLSGNPFAMLAVGARPLARAAVLSPAVQNRLVQGARGQAGPNALNLLQGGYRAAPLIGADR